MEQNSSVNAMWDAFVAQDPAARADKTYEAWHFCDNKKDADELAELVLAGVKRATAGAWWEYEADGDPFPETGALNIITDWDGNAKCIIEMTSVDLVPFNEVTEEFAATEGEGDGSLAYWKQAHWEAFSRGLAAIGLTPTEDMPVVCQKFEVVFP